MNGDNFRHIAVTARKGVIASAFCIAWSAVLIAMMATGTLSTARIGAMTWGPQHDVWSAAIAISQIRFGLGHELAYKEVVQAITDDVTSTKNIWNMLDDQTRSLDADPAAVTKGFKAAAALKKEDIAIPSTKDGYVTDWCEDLGYADFYNLAFRLFGFSAFSTHYLYFTLLSTSSVLFVLAFFGDGIAIASLTLMLSALFLMSASSEVFSESVPSFAANRFVSTLAFVPLMHILLTALRRGPTLWREIALLAAQALILSFAIAARQSATWCIVAIVLCAAVLISMARTPDGTGGGVKRLVARLATPQGRRISIVSSIVVGVFLAVSLIRSSWIDERYYWDDNYPHHLIWHSAYLGLAQNPEWESKRPQYPGVPAGGDGAGFQLFEHAMAERGLSAVSSYHEVYHLNYYQARAYEAFIRHEYLTFVAKNPSFAAKLFLYYKPDALFEIIKKQVSVIPRVNWAFAVVSIALSLLCLAIVPSGIGIGGLLICCGIVSLSSLMPILWAYAAPYADADELWCVLFMSLILIVAIGAAIMRSRRAYDSSQSGYFGTGLLESSLETAKPQK